MKENGAYRLVSPQEAYDLQTMFPDIKVDYTQFKVFYDYYTQSTKTSCDTLNDTWCDFYIPPKPTILKSWEIETDVRFISSAKPGGAGAGSYEDAKHDGTECVTLNSAPSTIERHYWLHGNSAGDILYEITNHAHNLLEMRMQGKEDASEYGYYVYDENYEGAA